MDVLGFGLIADWGLSCLIVSGVLLCIVMGHLSFSLFWASSYSLMYLWFAGVPELYVNVLFAFLVILNVPAIRGFVISAPVMKVMTALKVLPKISKTERAALEAGTVWMDKELFGGKPNFKTLMDQNYPDLSDEEQAFLDGPCEELCAMVEDWDVHKNKDFSPKVWEFMKKNKFFGLIIPKEFGGLGFSAIANSAIVAKLSSRSTALGITVMVPNSLGPAELLIHYGTDKQKDQYLKKLAIGEEIPCFALTEPLAGSDAGAIRSEGVVFKGTDGAPWIRLNWDKRYITLSAISTLLGLAFKLKDPDNLLGKGENLGINCALIPTKTKGVEVGRRHDPMSVPFINAPTQGHDVEVPLSCIIGGAQGVGHGWKMLMECLSAGRGISLPANGVGGIKFVTRVASAYVKVRRQFGLPIGKFEGIMLPLGKMAGLSYMLEGARRYTCGGLDSGAKPAVVTAIMKYQTTELFREVINDGMDILGGAAISLGPKNLLAHPYFAAPIGITVEGANILTRTLIVFGQGAIRCHPYVLKEIHALEKGDVKAFDAALFGHIGHMVCTKARYAVLYLTRGRGFKLFPVKKVTRYKQKLTWASTQFALLADFALMKLGGDLKRKEALSGRYADALSWLYLAVSALKRFEAEGSRKEDELFLDWSLQMALSTIQKSVEGILKNFGLITLIPYVLTRLNPLSTGPRDHLVFKLATAIQTPGAQRDRLTDGIYRPKNNQDALTKLEQAFTKASEVEALIRKARHETLTEQEALDVDLALKACEAVIAVDDFKTL